MIAIRVEHLSKKYSIGADQLRHDSLRDALTAAVKNLKPNRILKSGRLPRNEIWALNDVSFDIQRGKVVGVIGRNGAGKSTLLKVLAHITNPTKGRVEIHGRVGSLLEVGTGFHNELTGRENIYLNGAILGMKKAEIERKFDEIVDFAEIEKFLDTPVKHYSSGMYMRLAFAVAAHLEPEILLVDEVLAVGDAEFQKKCLGKMGEVAGEGRTVLFVSHNMGAIQRLCRTVFLLDRGCIIKSGVSQEVTQEYLQMNTAPSLIWARTDSDDSDAYLERIYLCNDKGEIITVVTTGIALQIVMEFTLRRIPYNLQVSVGLVNENGEQVFGSSPQDSGAYPPNKPGKYRSVVYFPEGLLMPRTYMVRAVLWTPELGALDSKDKIKFTAIETASLGNSTPGGRLGMIALRCKWEFQTLKQ